MRGVVVRRFEPRDEPAVVALWRESFPDDPPRNEPRAMIARKLARDPELFWVATADGVVVGAVMAGYDGVRGWLYHLAVAPDWRRRGVASSLVSAAVAALEALGCPKVNLQVRETNADVVELYEGLGFARDSSMAMGLLLDR